MIISVRRKVLTALIEAGGELTLSQIEALYERRGKGGDALHVAALNKFGYTEYVRPAPGGNDTGLRILDAGRRALTEADKA